MERIKCITYVKYKLQQLLIKNSLLSVIVNGQLHGKVFGSYPIYILVVLWQSKYDPFANSSDIISYKWGDAQCFYGSQIYIYLWINGYQRPQKRTEKQYSSISLLSGHWCYPKNISHWKRVEIVFLIICLCTIWFSVYSCY